MAAIGLRRIKKYAVKINEVSKKAINNGIHENPASDVELSIDIEDKTAEYIGISL